MTRRLKVLVVDRAEEIKNLAAVRLDELEIDLTTATDGQQGLECAEREMPDLILLGVGLPDVSGFEVCEQLKRDPVTHSIPIMFVTGSNDPDHKLRGFELGAVDYVTKPYHAAELRARVKRSLETSAMVDVLETQASTDGLTQLANRTLLTERLWDAIKRSKLEDDYEFAVLFLDFDRFKIINDSLGHQIGDSLLVSIAQRLRDILRTHSRAGKREHLPARLGGDEFVILLDEIDSLEEVLDISQALQDELAVPHQISNLEVTSTASIGIVTSAGRYDRADDVLRDADTAMYHAKSAGRAHHVVFDARMHAEAVDRLTLEQELRGAYERNEYLLHYQPIMSLQSGELIGFEALLRWKDAEAGATSRPDFIQLAEEIGLIIPLGTWVLWEAARQGRAWQLRFPHDPPLEMNVNVSKRQITQPGFLDVVREVLDETSVAPRSLKLEITESVIMDHFEELTPVLQRIRALNLQMCLDDFGTGHSSLSCLHRFPIDVLKIDRAFLMNMDENRQYAAVTHAIVTLAHNFGVSVVAEGVESAAQLAQLQALECDFAQGYYFARPKSPEAAEEFVQASAKGRVVA